MKKSYTTGEVKYIFLQKISDGAVPFTESTLFSFNDFVGLRAHKKYFVREKIIDYLNFCSKILAFRSLTHIDSLLFRIKLYIWAEELRKNLAVSSLD